MKDVVMITRRYREPRGLYSNTDEYGFFVRLSGDDRKLMKTAQMVAAGRLGGPPSNPMFLLDMMKVYIERNNSALSSKPTNTSWQDNGEDI